MLNRQDLEKFRIARGLSYREVANYCNISHAMISEVEKGIRGLSKQTHDEIPSSLFRNSIYSDGGNHQVFVLKSTADKRIVEKFDELLSKQSNASDFFELTLKQ